MRVVAGTARGVPLEAPRGRAVRPTSDRVKEATFNALGSMGVLVDATVLDLFAGSGALGIEALSRGASHATFVDSSAAAITSIEQNLARTRLDDRARVLRSDAVRHVATMPSVDVALLDPPYDFTGWPELLDVIPAATIVVESDRPIALPARYGLRRDRRYGTTVVLIAQLQELHP